MPDDGVISVPAIDGTGEEKKMDDKDYGMLKLHAHNAAQRVQDGAQAYAENLRYDYLEGKANVSLTEGLGVRYIQGPHPYYGSPDGKPA